MSLRRLWKELQRPEQHAPARTRAHARRERAGGGARGGDGGGGVPLLRVLLAQLAQVTMNPHRRRPTAPVARPSVVRATPPALSAASFLRSHPPMLVPVRSDALHADTAPRRRRPPSLHRRARPSLPCTRPRQSSSADDRPSISGPHILPRRSRPHSYPTLRYIPTPHTLFRRLFIRYRYRTHCILRIPVHRPIPSHPYPSHPPFLFLLFDLHFALFDF